MLNFRRVGALTFTLALAMPSLSYGQVQLNLGEQQLIFNANNTAAPQTGTVYALPGAGRVVTWITSFGSTPASVSTILEFSNDNSVFAVGDTSTNVNGESRTVFTAARFVRATETARSGGSAITVSVISNTGAIATISTTGGTLSTTGISNSSGQILTNDGTSLLPAWAFISEPTLGFWRSSAGNITLQGALKTTSLVQVLGGSFFIGASGSSVNLRNVGTGLFNIQNDNGTFGSQIKVDALPTISSGFGTSPAIAAGSTPFAGAIVVGNPNATTTGVVNFNGTAFPSAPFCVIGIGAAGGANQTNIATSTTQLTLTTAVAWPASSVITYICPSSK